MTGRIKRFLPKKKLAQEAKHRRRRVMKQIFSAIFVAFVAVLLCGCPEEVPELTVTLDSTYTVNVGEDLAIQAQVSGGTPPYALTWYLNGQERDSIVSGLLYLSDATKADDGYLRVFVVDQNGQFCHSIAVVDVVGSEVEEGEVEGQIEGEGSEEGQVEGEGEEDGEAVEGESDGANDGEVVEITYTLTSWVEPAGLAGTVLTSTANPHLAGEIVDVWVFTPSGYTFSHWLGDVANPNVSSTTITMNGNETIVAVFDEIVVEEKVTVPDFSNLGWLDASAQAMNLGLIVDNGTSHCSDVVVNDHIISQSPIAGSLVDPGTEVNFVLSSGPCTVPTYTLTTEVVGGEGGHIEVTPTADEYVAGAAVTIKALADEGWVFGGWSSNDVAISHMTSPLNITVDCNMTVMATFYRTVPDFSGMTMFDALIAAVDAGLQTDSEDYECSDTIAANLVLSQSLLAGTPIIGEMPALHLTFSSGPCTIEGEEEGQVEGEGTEEGEPEGNLEGEPEGAEEGEVEGTTEGEGAEEGEMLDPCLNPEGLTATITPNTLAAYPGDEVIVELRLNRSTCLVDMFGFLISFDQKLEMIQDEAAIDGWEIHADSVASAILANGSDLTPATPTTFPTGAFYFFAVRIPEDAAPGELNFAWGVSNFFLDVTGEEINVELFDGMIEILPAEEEGEGEGTVEGEPEGNPEGEPEGQAEGEGAEEGEQVTIPTINFGCSNSDNRLPVSIQIPADSDIHDYLMDPGIGQIAYIVMAGPEGNWVNEGADWSPTGRTIGSYIEVSGQPEIINLTTRFEPWTPIHFRGTLFAVDVSGVASYFELAYWTASFGENDEAIVPDGSGGQIIDFIANSGGCQ
jgi:hypothetical protein